jgi:hypothetical protein
MATMTRGLSLSRVMKARMRSIFMVVGLSSD